MIALARPNVPETDRTEALAGLLERAALPGVADAGRDALRAILRGTLSVSPVDRVEGPARELFEADLHRLHVPADEADG